MPSMENAAVSKAADDRGTKAGGNGARPFMASFLDHLVRNAIVAADVAQRAISIKQSNPTDRRSVTEILQEEFKVPREVLQYQIAQFYAFRTIDINDRSPRKLPGTEVLRLLKSLPEPVRTLALRHKILPYDLVEAQSDKLVIVTPNPSDREVTEVARTFPFKKFEICYMKEREWDELYRMLSSDKPPQKPVSVITDVPPEVIENDLDGVLDREIARTQLPATVEKILNEAIKCGAGAIHMIPRTARKTDIEFRVNGALSHWMSIEEVRAEAIAAAVKVRTPGMDRYERLAAQEGHIGKTVDGRSVHLHVSSVPVSLRDHPGKFETIIVQLSQEPEAHYSLEGLGMPEPSASAFREFLSRRSGMFLITGPAGSGKSTTIASLVRLSTSPSVRAIALEDACSWMIDGVSHIRRTSKLSASNCIDIVERSDADVILIGDLADRDLASRALRLALEGRQIFATMKARDTAGAIVWLQKMGVDPYLIAHGLSIIHAQRLVRRLCPKCKTASTAETGRLAQLGIQLPGVSLFKSVGCSECHQGFDGRVPLHETLPMIPQVRQLILNDGAVTEEQYRSAVRSNGGGTLVETAADLVKSGLTTLEEVWAVLS